MHSTLNFAVWQQELQTDPDKHFLLDGVCHGFRIVDMHAVPIPVETKNYPSTNTLRAAVDKQIKAELDAGRYVITKEKPTIISALGAIQKPDGCPCEAYSGL